MHWNYRVIRHDDSNEHRTYIWFGIHEVFYDDNGVPAACTENAMAPYWEPEENGEDVLRMMNLAFNKPVLEYSDFSPGGKYFGNSMWAKDDIETAMENGTLDDLLKDLGE